MSQIAPVNGQPFRIPDDWTEVDLGGCPNCDGVLMGKQAPPDPDEGYEPGVHLSWWRDETSVVCCECGCIAMISADGGAWIQEPSEPYEFVQLEKQS